MQDFKRLGVWRKAHELALQAYAATSGFPRSEVYGLAAQLRRSASSIPANLAECCGRRGAADSNRFYESAFGPAAELEYHLLLARDLWYLDLSEFDSLNGRVIEVKRMLAALIRSMRTRAAGRS